MRHIFLFVLLSMACTLRAITTQHELLVHFEKGRAELTSAAQAQLDAFLAGCSLDGEYRFTLNGHTDSDGSLAYNVTLSVERAQAVSAYLMQRGVPGDAIDVDHSGETAPIQSNREETGMAMNRRVAVTFHRRYFSTLDELRGALTEGSIQRFMIDPAMESTVEGAAGVRLRFPAHAFVGKDGTRAEGPVSVELTEALGHLSMIGHGLATRSGDRLLETGGMLRVTAVDAAGRELRLKEDAPMEVTVPTAVTQPGMELFLSKDGTDWSTTGQEIVAWERWVEPQRPAFPASYHRLPVYREDRKGMPVRPGPPALRKEPLPPRRDSYKVRRHFFSFLAPGKAEAKALARYEQAMDQYERRMQRHAQHVAAHQDEVDTYAERIAAYECRKEEWDERKKTEHEAWLETVYRPAVEAEGRINAARRERWDSLMVGWRERRDSSFAAYTARADQSGRGDMGGLRAYMFSTSSLGWINCDRFYDVPDREKHQIVAQGRTQQDAAAYLVFTEIFSMMPMERQDNGRWVSQRVPRQQSAVLFAYTVIDGRPHVCNQPVVAGRRPELVFEPSSFAEIGQLLRSFNARNV